MSHSLRVPLQHVTVWIRDPVHGFYCMCDTKRRITTAICLIFIRGEKVSVKVNATVVPAGNKATVEVKPSAGVPPGMDLHTWITPG